MPLPARLTGHDRESGRARGPHAGGGDALDPGQRRRLLLQQEQELRNRPGFALDLREHAVDVVADEAGQTQARRQPVYERPEPDALDDACYPHRGPDDPFAHPSSVAGPGYRRPAKRSVSGSGAPLVSVTRTNDSNPNASSAISGGILLNQLSWI